MQDAWYYRLLHQVLVYFKWSFVCSPYTVQQRWSIFVGQKIEMGSIVLNVLEHKLKIISHHILQYKIHQ